MPRAILLLLLIAGGSIGCLAAAAAAAAAAAETIIGDKLFYTTPLNVPFVSHRTDICERYFQVRNGTMEVKDALRGLRLSTLLGNYTGAYLNYNDETGIDPINPGIAAVVLDDLAERAGFTWRGSFGLYMDAKGAEYNETWTDILLWGIEKYDIVGDWWGESLDRVNMGMCFARGWHDSSLILIGKKDRTKSTDKEGMRSGSLFNWMNPFHNDVWLATLVTIIMTGLIFQYLEWIDDERKGRSTWHWFTDNLYLSSLSVLQAYQYDKPKRFATKLVGFSIALWSLVLAATYTANLASLLVEVRSPTFKDKIETMEEAALSRLPICLWDSSYVEAYIRTTFPSAVLRPKSSIGDVYDGLSNGECAFVVDAVQSFLVKRNTKQFDPDCDLEWLGDGRIIQPFSGGFVVNLDAGDKCSSLIRDVLSFHMGKLINEGSLEKYWEENNRQNQDNDCDLYLRDEVDINLRRRRQLHSLSSTQFAAHSSTAKRRNLAEVSSAAGSVNDAGSSDSDEQPLTLDQMFGTFVFHYALMVLAIMTAHGKKILAKVRNNYDRVTETESRVSEGDTRTSKKEMSIDEMKREIADFRSFRAEMTEKQEKMMEKQDMIIQMLMDTRGETNESRSQGAAIEVNGGNRMTHLVGNF